MNMHPDAETRLCGMLENRKEKTTSFGVNLMSEKPSIIPGCPEECLS